MSRPRRQGRAITGPQSALTDFLATHNISAAQIRSDYEARLRAAEAEAGPSNTAGNEELGEDAEDDDEEVENPQQTRKRKRQERAAIEKIKKSKQFAKKKKSMQGEPGEDDDDEMAFELWEKVKPLPGQMDNCEECEKRFTVTPYTKTGPDGGLLCTKCGKVQEDAKKKDTKSKVKKPKVTRDRLRQQQSNLMEGFKPQGAKSLLETCIERVAKSIDDVEDFGDLPPLVYDRLSQILSKSRALNSRTVDLFLYPENDRIAMYDCGRLQTDDFIKMFQICPKADKVDLRNAGQFKDKVVNFILERKVPIKELRLNASNLITDHTWQEFFSKAGHRLESLQLSWLDFAMTNPSFELMVKYCQNLRRLKLKVCFHMDDDTLEMLTGLQKLEHLSLRLPNPTNPPALTKLVAQVGHNLQSLCLRDFADADDTLIDAIATTCTQLRKLAITHNDRITDEAYAALFSNWNNGPLEKAFFTLSRDTEHKIPQPPGEADPNVTAENLPQPEPLAGLASAGFSALMAHSGSTLQKISIASCRHISHATLLDVFDGRKKYPYLSEIDVSFVGGVDNTVIAGMFKSCPSLVKLVAFGCFDIQGVEIPRGVALIGVPAAQDNIIQEGEGGMDLDVMHELLA